MRLTIHATAAEFLADVRPTLAEHEAEHHLVLGVAEGVARDATPNAALFAATVRDADGLALAGFRTGKHPLLVATDREIPGDAVSVLCDALIAAGQQPRHVIGALGLADAVADAWRRRTGNEPKPAMHQRVYKLTEVVQFRRASGELRLATAADLELVTRWITAFEHEALGAIGLPGMGAVAERKVRNGELYLWCDPEPRTMAGWARPTARAIAVNAVYTPAEWRQRGYATACVAELSALLLRRGFEFCVLYTDLANPTSNSIYTKIGYRPVRDFLMYEVSP